MKMQVIVDSKRKKDFWDIHELLECFTLGELIQYGLQRNPYTLDENDILDSLCKLNECEELRDDSLIICLRGKYWEFIVDDLRSIAEQYRKLRFA
jgi:hypothetical protein